MAAKSLAGILKIRADAPLTRAGVVALLDLQDSCAPYRACVVKEIEAKNLIDSAGGVATLFQKVGESSKLVWAADFRDERQALRTLARRRDTCRVALRLSLGVRRLEGGNVDL